MPYPISLNNIRNNFWKSRKEFKEEIETNVTVHHVSRPFVFPPFNRRSVNEQIIEIIDEYDIDIIFSESFLWDFVPPFNKVPVIYDMVDDHLEFFKNAPLTKRIMSSLSRVKDSVMSQIKNSNHTIFVSSVLKDKYGEICQESSIIPNGVHLESFKRADPEKYIDSFGLDDYDWVVGYIGYFGEWSNLYKSAVNIQEFLEKNNGLLIIVGIGPEAEKLKKDFGDNERFLFTGMIDPREIPPLAKTFDIGLLPFKKCPYTDAASPIKYFEYAAAGSRVVSSPLEEIKRIKFKNTVFFDKIEDINMAMEIASDLDFNHSELENSLKKYDWDVLSLNLNKILKSMVFD